VKASEKGKRISPAKAVTPVAVKRQGRGHKNNLAVIPLVARPGDVNPIIEVLQEAIDWEWHTFDLGVEIARPIVDFIDQVVEMVVRARSAPAAVLRLVPHQSPFRLFHLVFKTSRFFLVPIR
jgi:hypothetical protein